MTHGKFVSFLWGVADLIRDPQLRRAAGFAFYNTSRYDFEKLLADGETRRTPRDGKDEDSVVSLSTPTPRRARWRRSRPTFAPIETDILRRLSEVSRTAGE